MTHRIIAFGEYGRNEKAAIILYSRHSHVRISTKAMSRIKFETLPSEYKSEE